MHSGGGSAQPGEAQVVGCQRAEDEVRETPPASVMTPVRSTRSRSPPQAASPAGEHAITTWTGPAERGSEPVAVHDRAVRTGNPPAGRAAGPRQTTTTTLPPPSRAGTPAGPRRPRAPGRPRAERRRSSPGADQRPHERPGPRIPARPVPGRRPAGVLVVRATGRPRRRTASRHPDVPHGRPNTARIRVAALASSPPRRVVAAEQVVLRPATFHGVAARNAEGHGRSTRGRPIERTTRHSRGSPSQTARPLQRRASKP